ncbi:HNH endonuclease [Paenibacillus sp. CF095]|uniref:HNH endonuclease n=1 Tax=Paenibacillus sp. CF095 TaxID=1881033 RepID=UPI0008873574|nr:HNH endonuclease [Paenibacillus sp. CF095]SDD52527.1 HNH endonuclease [Paenibacillus sp. CF095]
MKRETAEKLISMLTTSAHQLVNYTFEVIELSGGDTVTSFHQWADNKPVLGLFLIGNAGGEQLYFLIIAWNQKVKDNYYLVTFPYNRSRPITELHKTETFGNTAVTSLVWKYKPMKRDGKNQERKQYFKNYYGDLNVTLSLPQVNSEVEVFIEDLFLLCKIRMTTDDLSIAIPDRMTEFPEGRLLEKRHLQRERNSTLIKLAKQQAMQREGKLICQVCGFDFKVVYGALGENFIEAHHTVPLSELDEDSKTKIEDIALVCSNCHQMLHRMRPWLKKHQLNQLLQ